MDMKFRMHRSLGAMTIALLLASGAASAVSKVWKESLAHEAKGELDQAAALIESKLSGLNAEFASIRMGWLHYRMGNYNDSIRMYRRALSLNTRSIDAQLGQTLPLIAQQRWREVARISKQVLSQSPWNITAHTRLMQAEEGLRKWDTLALHASKVAQHYPTNVGPLVFLARANAWNGKAEDAYHAYQRVLVAFPGHLEANNYIANNPRE